MTATSAEHPRALGQTRWPELARTTGRLVAGALGVWLVVCGVGLLLTHPLTRAGFVHWEGGVDRWFAGHRTGLWNSLTNSASLAGDTPAAIGISVVAFVVLRLATRRWREAVMLAVAMLGEVAIFTTSTLVVDRPRPTVRHLDGSPPTSSFPSGHTAASTTLYGVLVVVVLAYAGRTVWRVLAPVVAMVIVLSIGASRLYRGMHYPSDVAGGILLGLLWVTVVSLVLLRPHLPGREGRR